MRKKNIAKDHHHHTLQKAIWSKFISTLRQEINGPSGFGPVLISTSGFGPWIPDSGGQ